MSLSAALLLCTAIAVQDGDTLRARCEAPQGGGDGPETITVRLHAIDAPEHRQPYGRRAHQALRALVWRRPVSLHCFDTDAYHRRVCQVFVAAGDPSAGRPPVDAGLALVEQGLAWWYRYFSDGQTAADRARYAAAEDTARQQRLGLWRQPSRAVPPWQWRRTHPRHLDAALSR